MQRTLDTEPANMTLGTDGSRESGGFVGGLVKLILGIGALALIYVNQLAIITLATGLIEGTVGVLAILLAAPWIAWAGIVGFLFFVAIGIFR